MNQSSSALKPHGKKSTTATLPQPNQMKMEKRSKKIPQQRSAFQDLSNGYFNSNSKDGNFDNKSSGNASSMSTTSSSIEAPKGCLRFFLSHSSSSSSSSTSSKTAFNNVSSNRSHHRHAKVKPLSLKTPKSAPSARPNKENLSRRGFFHKSYSQKVEKVKKNQSGKTQSESGECDAANLTPLSKVNTGLCLNFVVNDDDEKGNVNSNTKATSSDTKTPPVQASVSPEIQCGSSMMSLTAKTTTPVCYGAGHLMSGVTDKRKCRARGILTVGEAKALDCFDSDDNVEMDNGVLGVTSSCNLSMLPFPAEASMHWLLSPCNEEDEDEKENSENGFDGFQSLEECPIFNSPASASSGTIGFSPNLCNSSNDRSPRRRRTSVPMLSPCEFRGCLRPPLYDNLSTPCSEPEKSKCNIDADKSPVSLGSLDSGNVIQTPQSDMSSEGRFGMSWLCAEDNRHKQIFDSELNDVADHLQMASLSSPKSHASIWDPTSSSFQFDCLTTPSNSVDLSRFQKVLDDRASWFSNSTLENVSQSQMRISWRDGLVSRIFEMDEFDSCRCLSDEEDDAEDCNNDGLKFHQGPEFNVDIAGDFDSNNAMELKEFVDKENRIDEKAKKRLPLGPQLPYSCAESISTDGGDLGRSEDSDWTICYKNHLFQSGSTENGDKSCNSKSFCTELGLSSVLQTRKVNSPTSNAKFWKTYAKQEFGKGGEVYSAEVEVPLCRKQGTCCGFCTE